MMNKANLQSAFVVTMTITTSLAGAGSEQSVVSVSPGFVLQAATSSEFLPAQGVGPQQSEAQSTQRPQSKRRQALLQTAQGQAMQAQALKDLGTALDAHGLVPLVALRMRCGLSQKALCEASGLPQPHISRLENGKVPNPDGATLQRLAQALGVRMDEVLSAIQGGAKA
jgi:DNA-binding Xre family transcriptional regulator